MEKNKIFITSTEKEKSKKELKHKTIFDLINEPNNGNPLPINNNPLNKDLLKKKRKNSLLTLKTISNNKSQTFSTITNNFNSSNDDYIKSIKPKVIMINGKIEIEKPDIGLINKQYTENLNKNLLPLEESEDLNDKKISSLSFKKVNHCNKWKEEDTFIFYKAIEIFGLDFSFLEIVLFPRTRNEIKKKYLKEEKINKDKLYKAINAKKNVSKMFEVLKVFQNQEKNKDFNSSFNNESNNIKEYQNILLKKGINHSEKDIKNILDNFNNQLTNEDLSSEDEIIINKRKTNKKNNNKNNLEEISILKEKKEEDNFINSILNKFKKDKN
jgi:hypothetical protein